jgi:large subunit ribosomal protein L18
VFKSNKFTYAQIIDDNQGKTLVEANSSDMKAKKMDAAIEVGKLVATKAKTAGVTKVVFDRNGYKYTGRILALAEAAREAGLEF